VLHSSSLQSHRAAFSTGCAEQDVLSLTALFSSQANLIPSDLSQRSGRQEVGAYLSSLLESGVASASLSPLSMSASDARASPSSCSELGHYVFRDRAGTVMEQGRYLAVLQREQGEWKYAQQLMSRDRRLMSSGVVASGWWGGGEHSR
jgi:hypothetical protein